jgi:hypothetical protein
VAVPLGSKKLEPERGYSGMELESAAEVRAYRAENPCPSTGKTRGASPGWQVDHPDPLCAGGRDHPSNMQWITVADHKWKTFVDVRECRKARLERKLLVR